MVLLENLPAGSPVDRHSTSDPCRAVVIFKSVSMVLNFT